MRKEDSVKRSFSIGSGLLKSEKAQVSGLLGCIPLNSIISYFLLRGGCLSPRNYRIMYI